MESRTTSRQAQKCAEKARKKKKSNKIFFSGDGPKVNKRKREKEKEKKSTGKLIDDLLATEETVDFKLGAV